MLKSAFLCAVVLLQIVFAGKVANENILKDLIHNKLTQQLKLALPAESSIFVSSPNKMNYEDAGSWCAKLSYEIGASTANYPAIEDLASTQQKSLVQIALGFRESGWLLSPDYDVYNNCNYIKATRRISGGLSHSYSTSSCSELRHGICQLYLENILPRKAFLLIEEPLIWFHAQGRCINLGGQLAQTLDVWDTEFLAISMGVYPNYSPSANSVWLGLTAMGKCCGQDFWGWNGLDLKCKGSQGIVDNPLLTKDCYKYLNWLSGEPVYRSSPDEWGNFVYYDCVTQSYLGKNKGFGWKAGYCEHKRPFVCEFYRDLNGSFLSYGAIEKWNV